MKKFLKQRKNRKRQLASLSLELREFLWKGDLIDIKEFNEFNDKFEIKRIRKNKQWENKVLNYELYKFLKG